MNQVFESERILFIEPTLDLVPEYLVMVNDIENVAKFIGERRTSYLAFISESAVSMRRGAGANGS